MAYNDDSVLAKLSAVNESHESVASSAQWIIFHRRFAERTVDLWMQKLKNSSSTKRLSLIYLANEVSQQSKARNKMEFITAFSPTIAEAVATAYKGAPTEIQGKLKRVIDVWRDRHVFDENIQDDIDKRVADLDKNKGTAVNSGFSAFNSTQLPKEIAPLVPLFQAASTRTLPVKTAFASADQDYRKLEESKTTVSSSPPVYAARLNGLLKLLGTAENALEDSVKIRTDLVNTLDKILASHRNALAEDESNLQDIRKRKFEVVSTRDKVENDIMSGLNKADNNTTQIASTASDTHNGEPDRPVVEALTPPAIDGSASDNGSSATYQSLHSGENGSNKRRRVDEATSASEPLPAESS